MKDIEKMTTHEIAQYLRHERKTAFILWQVEDVLLRADDGHEISVEEAEGIIENLNEIADCNYGITWDTLDNGIDNLLNERRIL